MTFFMPGNYDLRHESGAVASWGNMTHRFQPIST